MLDQLADTSIQLEDRNQEQRGRFWCLQHQISLGKKLVTLIEYNNVIMKNNADNPIWGEPEHHQHAEALIAYVSGELVGRFPTVRFDVMNVTDDDVASSPGMIEAARLEGLEDLAADIERDGMQADIESALATQVRTFMYSDVLGDINHATDLLAKRAGQLRGNLTDDTGTIHSGTRRALDRILGHNPQHEDALQYMRAIGYKFT